MAGYEEDRHEKAGRHSGHAGRDRSRSPRRDGSHSKRRSRSPGSARRRSHEQHRREESSRHDRHSRSPRQRRSRSRSPMRRDAVRSRSPQRQSPVRARGALPSQEQSFHVETGLEKPVEKQKPNYKHSGLLAADSNKVIVAGEGREKARSIVLKYHEPPESRKPPASQQWIVYVFKGSSPDPVQTIPLHTRSCWLVGREAAVADIPMEHPSCSKQHAVFQFRYVTKKDQFGDRTGKVCLYVIDLESSNGTFVNGERIEQARYMQCLNNDVVKFGDSKREFVVMLPSKE